MIETRNLTKTFDNFTAVDSLDLKIETGEFFGLLGPNGAGKTTTPRCSATKRFSISSVQASPRIFLISALVNFAMLFVLLFLGPNSSGANVV